MISMLSLRVDFFEDDPCRLAFIEDWIQPNQTATISNSSSSFSTVVDGLSESGLVATSFFFCNAAC